MKKNAAPSGELALIDHIRHVFPATRSRTIPLGIGDDCAILRPPEGHEILITTDFTLEDRHFRRDLHPAASVGHRCLARGLSDLAAMGAAPRAAFLSLALPASFPASAPGKRWIAGFLKGMQTLAKAGKVNLAGGDTAQSPRDVILADIVLVGSAPAGTALRRSTARAGDMLYVTGQLGGAAAELRTMLAHGRTMLAQGRPMRLGSGGGHPQLFPEPRVATGKILRSRGLATACIDLSDGLSSDLTHLCKASGVRAEVDATALSIHPLASAFKDSLDLALHGGEDYELLFTAHASTRMPRTLDGVRVTPIGRILKTGPGKPLITLISPNFAATPLMAEGWQHFVS